MAKYLRLNGKIYKETSARRTFTDGSYSDEQMSEEQCQKWLQKFESSKKKIAREVKNSLIDIAENWLNSGGTYDTLNELNNEIRSYFSDLTYDGRMIEEHFPRV